MEAIEQAYHDGADGFECDVRMTKDGIPVVIHDADLMRVAHHSGVINQMTKYELDSVRLRTGERIPSVAEVMDFVRQQDWRVVFEIKDSSPELAKKLIKMQSEFRLRFEQCQFLTYAQNARVLTDLKRDCPFINTSAMFKIPRQLIRRAKELNINTICVGWLSQSQKWFFYGMAEFFMLREQIAQAKQRGFKVISGITTEPIAVKYLAELGVDGIWSNDIPALRQALNYNL